MPGVDIIHNILLRNPNNSLHRTRERLSRGLQSDVAANRAPAATPVSSTVGRLVLVHAEFELCENECGVRLIGHLNT